jgi:hypothetical protein
VYGKYVPRMVTVRLPNHRSHGTDRHELKERTATKIHLTCDGKGRLLAIPVTPGHRHNSVCARPLMERIRVPRTGLGRPRCRPDQVIADKTPHAAVRSSCCR